MSESEIQNLISPSTTNTQTAAENKGNFIRGTHIYYQVYSEDIQENTFTEQMDSQIHGRFLKFFHQLSKWIKKLTFVSIDSILMRIVKHNDDNHAILLCTLPPPTKIKQHKYSVSPQYSSHTFSVDGISYVVDFIKPPNPKWPDHEKLFVREALVAQKQEVRRYDYANNSQSFTETDHPEDTHLDILNAPDLEEAKARIRRLFSSEDILTKGQSVLNNWERMQAKAAPVIRQKPGFPYWALKQIAEIQPHIDDLCQEKCRCQNCELYWAYHVLKLWHDNEFIKGHEMMKYQSADGSTYEEPARHRPLILLGGRQCGKSRFFKSLGYGDPKLITGLKHTVAKGLLANLDTAWLFMIDDFTHTPEYEEMTKAIMASDWTVISGRWCAEHYKGGVPCAVVTNNKVWYDEKRKNELYKDECYFVNIRDVYIGPPETKPVDMRGMAKQDRDNNCSNENSNNKILGQTEEDKSFLNFIPKRPSKAEYTKLFQAYHVLHGRFISADNERKSLQKGRMCLEQQIGAIQDELKKVEEERKSDHYKIQDGEEFQDKAQNNSQAENQAEELDQNLDVQASQGIPCKKLHI